MSRGTFMLKVKVHGKTWECETLGRVYEAVESMPGEDLLELWKAADTFEDLLPECDLGEARVFLNAVRHEIEDRVKATKGRGGI